MNTYKLHLSIAFLSAAIIAFQLALIQILSIVQWYHFAYMVISVALLGFGAAGSVLAIFRKSLVNQTDRLLSLLMIGTSIATLRNDLKIPVYEKTVLKVAKNTELYPLEYLLKFLDAYDFGAETRGEIQTGEEKILINAS